MRRLLIYIAAALLAVVILAPVAWLVILSVSPATDITTVPLKWIPSRLDLSRYVRLVTPDPAGQVPVYLLALRNSVVVGVGGTALALAISVLAAWRISRHHRGDGFLHLMVAT